MIEIRPVGYILGWLTALFGALMAVPMVFDVYEGDPNARAFALSAVIAIVCGAGVAIACNEQRGGRLTLRQGFLLTTAAWAILPAVGGLPLMLGEPGLGFTDAYFEFTSAMTTTGATVIVGIDTLPQGALLWRGMVTWLGGTGVILLAMILLPVLNIGGMQMLRNADFNTIDKIMPRAKAIAFSIGGAYVVLTFACGLGYVWAGLSTFDSIVHAFSTIATGGMGNYDTSFIALPPAAQYVGTVFMLLGALTFIRYVQFARGDPGALFRDSQIRAFFAIYFSLCLALLVARIGVGDAVNETTVREILFNLASILTTTGFVSADYTAWGPAAEVILFCAMLICGCSGSTAGGPKVFRYQLLLGAIAGEVRRLHSPNFVHIARFQGAAVSDSVLDSVIAFLMLFFLTLALGAIALALLGLDPISAISGSAASLSNIGPGLGPLIGPVGSYAPLSDPAKWVCAFLMLVGRLELMTAYVLLTAGFWRT